MDEPNRIKRAQHLKERNAKMASILVLLITIYQKIERLKQKICGFSPLQFSPQSIFEALDLTGKGYLDTYDIQAFLGNDSIDDKSILILFSRLGDEGQGRLTYLGYLGLLKPFFDYELARDLLLRDTVTHRQIRTAKIDQKNLHQLQQTVLILLNELILLHCICIAEHESLKVALNQEYMLNQIQIKEILGLGGKVGALKAIYEFISCNSEYEITKEQVKYILALAQTNEPSLLQEKYMNMLFIPARNLRKKNKAETDAQFKINRQMQSLHANYSKDFLGKADLFTTTNKLSYLNYIHPNSVDKPVNDIPSYPKIKQKQYLKEEQHIDQQHKKLSISQQKIHRPFKPENKPTQRQIMTQSIVQRSNLHQFGRPSRLQQIANDQIDTPVLEQFMHESNIKRNMGNYKGKPRQLELYKLMEQSAISEEDGIVRVDHTSYQETNKYLSPHYIPKKEKQAHQERSSVINKSIINQHSKLFGQNKSNISNVGDTSGILNQFLKSQFR